MTSAQESRAIVSSPTLKVIHDPRPTSGSISPLDGIGLFRIVVSCVWAIRDHAIALATAAASVDSRLRRVRAEDLPKCLALIAVLTVRFRERSRSRDRGQQFLLDWDWDHLSAPGYWRHE